MSEGTEPLAPEWPNRGDQNRTGTSLRQQGSTLDIKLLRSFSPGLRFEATAQPETIAHRSTFSFCREALVTVMMVYSRVCTTRCGRHGHIPTVRICPLTFAMIQFNNRFGAVKYTTTVLTLKPRVVYLLRNRSCPTFLYSA